MEDKPSPHRSDPELMSVLESRERKQSAVQKRQGKQLSYLILGLLVTALAVFLSFQENRELVWALATGAPPPSRVPAVVPNQSKVPLVDPADGQLAKEVIGFMRSPEPPKKDVPPPK
ncbi:MAG: hypothetical protein JWO82_795 [Akkermansiaceae bacterium]|nr:hypothetical protein [Akkermansiaceae bacterium]